MLYILLGSDKEKKVEFVNHLKEGLSQGLWGREVISLLAKEITNLKQLQELFRSTGFAEQRMLVIWELDRLKASLFKTLPKLIRDYALENASLLLVLEGTGQRKTRSQEIASMFRQSVKVFGEVEEPSFFDLATAVIRGDISSAMALTKELDVDKYSFQQFTGAMRYLIETAPIPLDRKSILLSRLVDIDIDIRLGKKDPSWGIIELVSIRQKFS